MLNAAKATWREEVNGRHRAREKDSLWSEACDTLLERVSARNYVKHCVEGALLCWSAAVADAKQAHQAVQTLSCMKQVVTQRAGAALFKQRFSSDISRLFARWREICTMAQLERISVRARHGAHFVTTSLQCAQREALIMVFFFAMHGQQQWCRWQS